MDLGGRLGLSDAQIGSQQGEDAVFVTGRLGYFVLFQLQQPSQTGALEVVSYFLLTCLPKLSHSLFGIGACSANGAGHQNSTWFLKVPKRP